MGKYIFNKNIDDYRIVHPSINITCPECNKPIKLTKKIIDKLWMKTIMNYKIQKK